MKEIYKIQAEYIDKLKRFIFEGINNKSIEDIIYFIDDIELFWYFLKTNASFFHSISGSLLVKNQIARSMESRELPQSAFSPELR